MKNRRPAAHHRVPPYARCLRGLVLALAGFVITAYGGLRYSGVLAAVAPGLTIRNGSLEQPFVGGIAVMWQDNSWGDAVVSYSEETDGAHSGHSAQHIHCERVTRGAAQIRQLGLQVRAGQAYTLTAWMRGNVDGPVYIGVRQNGAPYQDYVARYVHVGPQWRRFVISATPAQDGPSAGVFFAFSTPGDLWIDDVAVREGEPAATQAALLPAHKGNLLYNSSFELGADGWGPVGQLQVQESGALDGRVCARCTPNWEPILLESRPVVIHPDQRYTISASLRASGPAEVEMVVMEYADGGDQPGQRDAIRQTFRIDRQWQRVSLSGVLRAPLVNGYVLQLNLRSGARTVWADALQWEEGGLTPFHPAAPVEVAVRAPKRFLSPGQPAMTDCRIYLAPTARAAVPVTYRLEDSEGRRVEERTLLSKPLLTPGMKHKGLVVRSRTHKHVSTPSAPLVSRLTTVQMTWKLPRPGIYRLVAVPRGTPVGRTGQAVFCLLPSSPRPATAPRFGIHSWSDPTTANVAVKAAAYLGAGGFRLHDFRSFVQWYEAEPEPGHFVWFDRDIDDLSQRGYKMLGTLCRTPLWAAQAGDKHHRYDNWCTSPPQSWDAWSHYVQAVVQHYHDRIPEWEVWNEPWGAMFWTGTPADYVQMLNLTRRAVKTVDPDALVVGGCFSPEVPDFTRSVLQAGGLEAMDVVSYHDYPTPAMVAEPPNGGQPASYRAAAELREEIRRRGGKQPLWCTETGVPCPSFYSWLPADGPRFGRRAAVGTLVKGLTLMLAAGVDRAYYYYVGHLQGGWGYPSRILNASYSLLDYDGSPKPTFPAFAQAVAMLGDATEPSDLSTPSLRAYAFRHEKQFVAVVWARGGAAPPPSPLTLSGDAPLTALDAWGAPLSSPVTPDDRPIYLMANSREALARTLSAAAG